MPRQLSFNREDALRQAMILFWERGYEAASVQQLTSAMGINRFSMYNTFGDKRALFLAALDCYAENEAAALLRPLEVARPDLSSIHEFFQAYLEHTQSSHGSMGCMLVLSGAECPNEPDTTERVSAHRARTRFAFERALRNAADDGKLRPHIYPRRRAAMLTTFFQGLTLQARNHTNTAFLQAAVLAVLDDLSG